jgi:heme A synthase
MGGNVIPSLDAFRPALMFAHRTLALLVGIYVGVVAVRAWPLRSSRRPFAVLALAAGGLYVAQALIGAANVWTKLATVPVVAHVAASSLIWAMLVAAAASSRACWTAHEAGPSQNGSASSGARLESSPSVQRASR